MILNSDKIISGDIGIIGGHKKKKPVEEQPPPIINDEVSSTQENENPRLSLLNENSKQYYDPFSKNLGPPRNENIWHYSLFPSTNSKKNNPGLSLFTTNRENRENKYSMLSSNFYCKNQEEDENEEENEKHQTSFSFDEKSDSEFSEKSFLQNKLNSSKYPCEQIEKKDIGETSIGKPEQEFTSRTFRTFNFPQGNNPFSLSQLLNPKPSEENLSFKPSIIENEKTTKSLNWNSAAFDTGNFENIVGVGSSGKNSNFYFSFNEGTEEFTQNLGANMAFRPNISTGSNNLIPENISRKPPPGFKPNK